MERVLIYIVGTDLGKSPNLYIVGTDLGKSSDLYSREGVSTIREQLYIVSSHSILT